MTIQTEYATIYVMIHDTIACLEGLIQLKEEYFTSSLTRQAFSVIKILTETGSPVDETLIKAKLNSSEFDKQYNSFIKSVQCDVEKYQAYFNEIKNESKKRRAIEILNQSLLAAEKATDNIGEILKRTEGQLLDIIVDPNKSTFSTLEDEAKVIIHELENPELITPPTITTGFRAFDEKVKMNNGDLVIIAGRPSMGKSAFALHLAIESAVKEGHDVLFYSIEMPKRQIVTRIISAYSGIALWKLLGGRGMTKEDWKRYEKYEPDIINGKRCFQINDDSMLEITDIMALSRREKMRNPNIKAIFVDYLQLMQTTGDPVIETTMISRSFKQLAKSLNIPAIVLSQLNRKCEEREDKRPMLSDLRDSGCLSGDTKIVRANGSHITIKELADNFLPTEILTLEESNMKIGQSTVTNAFSTGTKELYEIRLWSGRIIKATANHKFYTLNGWKQLLELSTEHKVAVPRQYNTFPHYTPQNMDEAIFIAHIIADGSCVKTIRYSTASKENLEVVKNIALRLGAKINGGWCRAARSYQLHFGSHTKSNIILQLFKDLKLHGKRAHEKFVPDFIFRMAPQNIAMFLQHLWACDGHFGIHQNNVSIHYSTTSYQLALDVQELLTNLGILSNIHTMHKEKYRDCYSVNIDGCNNQYKFLSMLDTDSLKGHQIIGLRQHLMNIKANTNLDTIPIEIWEYIKKALKKNGITHRQYAKMMDKQFNGNAAFRFCPSRKYLDKIANLLDDQYLCSLANSEIYWDQIKSIDFIGKERVYDLTIAGTHNFIANNIITHNSIEQDADLVVFMYRDYIYSKDEAKKTNCELIVAKQRNGETGTHYCGFDGITQRFTEIP